MPDDDMSSPGFFSVAEALSELAKENDLADDDRVWVHRKYCSDQYGPCICDPILLTGKEIKGVVNDR